MRRLFVLLLLACGAAFAGPRVSATPSEVVLGRDREVRIEIPKGAQLSWAASEGELTALDPGHLVWRAPGSGTPRTAVLLFWDPAEARPDPTVLRLPLFGRTDLEVDTEPKASVVVEIGGKSFGPRIANASGKVKVSVEVPPGAREATVHAEVSGRRTEREVPLELPPDVHLVAALSPHPIDARQGGWLMVAGVPPLTADEVTVEVTHAHLQRLRARDPLLYSVTPLPDADEVAASAERRGQPNSRTMTAAAVGQAPARPPARGVPLVFGLGGTAGGFLGNGAAKGFELALFGSVTPDWGAGRLGLELELGWRHTGLSQRVGALGTLHSSINVLPILLSARYLAYRTGPWQVAARLGVGVAPYDHRLSSDFEASFREGGTTWQLVAGAQAGYQLGTWSPFLELGYAYSPRIETPQVSAQLSGPRALLGVRTVLP